MQDRAAAVGPDGLAALKEVALSGGLSGTKVSCSGLARRLDASTQTASRRLRRLDDAGLLDRDVENDGQWVTVTADGEAALRGEFADYRRLFGDGDGPVLRGTVTGGMGEGRHYISLPGYMEQFRDRLGYEPFPGTLNVELDEESVRTRGELGGPGSVRIEEWADDDRTYGAATCHPVAVTAADGDAYGPAHVIVPDRTHHDESSLELIAPDRLRDALGLADGDELAIRPGTGGDGSTAGGDGTGDGGEQ